MVVLLLLDEDGVTISPVCTATGLRVEQAPQRAHHIVALRRGLAAGTRARATAHSSARAMSSIVSIPMRWGARQRLKSAGLSCDIDAARARLLRGQDRRTPSPCQ